MTQSVHIELTKFEHQDLLKVIEHVSVRDIIESGATVVTIAELWEKLTLEKYNGTN